MPRSRKAKRESLIMGIIIFPILMITLYVIFVFKIDMSNLTIENVLPFLIFIPILLIGGVILNFKRKIAEAKEKALAAQASYRQSSIQNGKNYSPSSSIEKPSSDSDGWK